MVFLLNVVLGGKLPEGLDTAGFDLTLAGLLKLPLGANLLGFFFNYN